MNSTKPAPTGSIETPIPDLNRPEAHEGTRVVHITVPVRDTSRPSGRTTTRQSFVLGTIPPFVRMQMPLLLMFPVTPSLSQRSTPYRTNSLFVTRDFPRFSMCHPPS